jgi:phage gpG-like protein
MAQSAAGGLGGMQVVITSSGIPEIERRMQRLADDAVEMRVVMAEIAELMAMTNKAAFGRGPALSQVTLDAKQAAGFPKNKLERTGALKESLTTLEGGPMGIREVTSSSLIFGTQAWYGIFAKKGTKAGGHNTGEPRRYVMSLPPKTRKQIRLIVMEHLGFGDHEGTFL